MEKLLRQLIAWSIVTMIYYYAEPMRIDTMLNRITKFNIIFQTCTNSCNAF